MKISCYYCKKYTNRSGYCGWCAWWTSRVDGKVSEVHTSVILKGNNQYSVNVYPISEVTAVYFKRELVLHINSLPFTPQNIRTKLPFYLTFS